MPTIKTDGTTDTPHDYVVTAIAKSLNGVSIAVKKVNKCIRKISIGLSEKDINYAINSLKQYSGLVRKLKQKC